jgi:hypothetical protein
MNAPGRPIFSIPPFARTVFVSISKSWYLMELLPQFKTKIFMLQILESEE